MNEILKEIFDLDSKQVVNLISSGVISQYKLNWFEIYYHYNNILHEGYVIANRPNPEQEAFRDTCIHFGIKKTKMYDVINYVEGMYKKVKKERPLYDLSKC